MPPRAAAGKKEKVGDRRIFYLDFARAKLREKCVLCSGATFWENEDSSEREKG